MFNYCQCCDARLWSSYTKNLGVCPECEELDKPLQDLEDDLESIFQPTGENHAHHMENRKNQHSKSALLVRQWRRIMVLDRIAQAIGFTPRK